MSKMRHRKIKAKFSCVWIAQGHRVIREWMYAGNITATKQQQNKSWIKVYYLLTEELTSEKVIFYVFFISLLNYSIILCLLSTKAFLCFSSNVQELFISPKGIVKALSLINKKLLYQWFTEGHSAIQRTGDIKSNNLRGDQKFSS